MRVLFWSDGFWPHLGGGDIIASRLVPALRERGHEIIVITRGINPGQPDDEYYKGIRIHRFPLWDPKSYTDIDALMEIRKEVSRIRRAFAPDLVHVNGAGTSDFFHMTTAGAHPAPLLISLHGEWHYFTLGPGSLAAQTLRAADRIVACSEAILKLALRLAPEVAPRSSVVYNSLEIPSLAPRPLSFDPPRLLFVGRLYCPDKGVDLALSALASAAGRFPHARLILAGDGQDRAKLEKQAVQLGISGMVEFLGWVDNDEVPSLINASTVVLVPSRIEAFGLVALEAALMARPVVASDAGGLPEVVVHGETGLIFEKDDADGLARAITFLLENPEEAMQMGQKARHRALKKFRWDRYVDAYDALYRGFSAG